MNSTKKNRYFQENYLIADFPGPPCQRASHPVQGNRQQVPDRHQRGRVHRHEGSLQGTRRGRHRSGMKFNNSKSIILKMPMFLYCREQFFEKFHFQVDQVVHVTWVQPRVLDTRQVKIHIFRGRES